MKWSFRLCSSRTCEAGLTLGGQLEPNLRLRPTWCRQWARIGAYAHSYGFPCIRLGPLMQEDLSEGRQTLSWGVS